MMIKRMGVLGLVGAGGAAVLAACVTIGSMDGSFILPDPNLSYPDALQHDDTAIKLGDVDESWSGKQPYEIRNYRLGPPDYLNAGQGGLTIRLTGTGYPLCVGVDPEALSTDECDYDDGDVDLFVGRVSEYTAPNPSDPEGDPLKGAEAFGTSLGDFQAEYVDDIGVTHTSDTNLCVFYNPAMEPAGRGQVESCAFETVAGEEYVIVLRTFTLPVDDNVLNLALLVQPGHRGSPGCVFNSKNYQVAALEDLDESDAAFDDNPYAENRDPCLCPKTAEEYEACGLQVPAGE